MAVPKRRKTRSRRGMRRSHDALQKTMLHLDKDEKVATRRHFMLPDGTYRGKRIKIIELKG